MSPTVVRPPSGIKVEGFDDDKFDPYDESVTAERAKPRRARASRQRDPKPQTEAPKSAASTEDPESITPNKVQDAFAEILSLPALAYKAPTPWKCDWCANHFARQGPLTAKELVDNRAHYPALYAGMEKIAAAWMAFSLAPMVLNYVAPPFIHHGPEVLEPIAPLFGVPPRERPIVDETINGVSKRRHEHTTASEGTIPQPSQPKS